MILRGHYGDAELGYASFKVLGCDLKDGCLSDVEVAKHTVNFVTLNTYPNILG